LTPPLAQLRGRKTHRLIPSRFPPVDVFATVAKPGDRDALTDLESWTNDRIQNELGERVLVPRADWATGNNASVVMAAFCHPNPAGGRFTSPDLGGWYAAFAIRTAHKEVAFHRWQEFAEVGVTTARVEMREYLANFSDVFHDVRDRGEFAAVYSPASYVRSQAFGVRLRKAGSNGIIYDSVRDPGHHCLVAFKPRLVLNVRQGTHFEYAWSGSSLPEIRKLAA
jgi:hypothetical protein